MRILCLFSLLLLLSGASSARFRPFRSRARSQPFTASAFSVRGTTAAGTSARKGTVAADPSILPLGSKIRVKGAGRYSGVYTVADTGGKVNGRHIDIFIPNEAAAKRFGKKTVTVDVIK